MADTLARIKRTVLLGRLGFSGKALSEIEADGLRALDVSESIANAVAIYKTLRSTRPEMPGKREYLYVIVSPTLSGFPLYTKGKFVKRLGVESYFLISAKRALR